MAALTITKRAATPEDLRRGRGECSGADGQWRVFDIKEGTSMEVFYDDGSVHRVSSAGEWANLPAEGLTAIVATGGYWHCADEYRCAGVPKYGLFLDDEHYERIEKAARSRLNASQN